MDWANAPTAVCKFDTGARMANAYCEQEKKRPRSVVPRRLSLSLHQVAVGRTEQRKAPHHGYENNGVYMSCGITNNVRLPR